MRPPTAAFVKTALLLAALASAAAQSGEGGSKPLDRSGGAAPRRAVGGRILAAAAAAAAPLVSRPTGLPYDIGVISVQDRWVDPVRGSDSNSGASRGKALRTLAAAWAKVPQRRALTRGFRIRITRGTVTQDMSESLEWMACWWGECMHGIPQIPCRWEAECVCTCHSSSAVPNYWESRWGTRGAPIIIEAADGRGSVTTGNWNVYDAR